MRCPSRRLASLLIGLALLPGCGKAVDEDAERATRARQMRDVSRMLDAMETPGDTPMPLPPGLVGASAASAAEPVVDAGSRAPPTPLSYLVVAGTSSLIGVAAWWFRRRRRSVGVVEPAPSIATFFAAGPVARVNDTNVGTAPNTWVYRSSPYETPTVHLVPEPVDLLLHEPAPPPDVPTPTATGDSLPMRLEAIDANPALHLIGDPRFPDLRRVGEGVAALDAWREVLEGAASAADDDGRLAGWLLPALLVLRSRDMTRKDAERLLDEADRLTRQGIDHADDEARGHWIGRAIRIELARIERMSGATRLFALRGLQARQSEDLGADDPAVIDAWIDVQLAWASWLLGGGAAARHAEADALCDRLEGLGDEATTLALRRRADIAMRRAETDKSGHRVSLLDLAQQSFELAYAREADPATALMLARCARMRAIALPPGDAAADACATALTHAFLAEQHPAWRLDALECRLAIQLTYEALPGRAIQGEVAASLGRELAAMDADSVGARTAMAATRLREGDFAGACALCEAAWRSGGADLALLNLWRDACRGWTETADSTGHDRHALAHAVRQLAIARATLRPSSTGHP